MMKNKILLLLSTAFILLCLTHPGQSQSKDSNTVLIVQPKIMVIPFTKEGEDLRIILEEDVNRRIAITKIKEGFDSKGFTTADFVAKLKAAKDNSVFTSDNQADIKSQIIELSGADIYVQSEVSVLLSSTGNSVTLVLSAFDVSTGNSLANKVGESTKFYTDDIGKLSSKAVDNCIDDFLKVMQSKFSEIVNNGRSVVVDISFDPNSEYKMSSEVGSDKLPLSDVIELWMGENAYKNNYHIQGTTDVKMIFDDVRIPLKDAASGVNFNPNKFALEIFKFFKSIGIPIAKDIKNNTIYITIK